MRSRDLLQKRQRKEEERREEEKNDLRAVLSTAGGRRFIWKQLERAGIFRSSFSEKENVTAFNEGSRNIGLKLLADIMETDGDKYALMQLEALKRKEEDSIRRREEK